MWKQYMSRNNLSQSGRVMGTWRLTPIRIVGGTSSTFFIEGEVFKSVDVGDMRSSCGLENVGVAIRTVWHEVNKLVGRVGVASKEGAECDLGHVGLGWMQEQRGQVMVYIQLWYSVGGT